MLRSATSKGKTRKRRKWGVGVGTQEVIVLRVVAVVVALLVLVEHVKDQREKLVLVAKEKDYGILIQKAKKLVSIVKVLSHYQLLLLLMQLLLSFHSHLSLFSL